MGMTRAGREQGRRQFHPGGPRGPGSPPDGHTLYFISTSSLITQALHPDYPFDLMKFTPVTRGGDRAADPGRAQRSRRQILQRADRACQTRSRARSSSASAAASAARSAFGTELLKARTGIKITVVPYRGAGPALNDLLGGHIDAMFDAMPVMAVQAKEGKVTPLAVTGTKRSARCPTCRPCRSLALPRFVVTGWYGILAPPGTPPAIVQKLRDEAAKAVEPPDVVKTLATQGMEPRGTRTAEYAKYLASELAFYTKIIKDANIKPD